LLLLESSLLFGIESNTSGAAANGILSINVLIIVPLFLGMKILLVLFLAFNPKTLIL